MAQVWLAAMATGFCTGESEEGGAVSTRSFCLYLYYKELATVNTSFLFGLESWG
jgi:hypothetical protein